MASCRVCFEANVHSSSAERLRRTKRQYRRAPLRAWRACHGRASQIRTKWPAKTSFPPSTCKLKKRQARILPRHHASSRTSLDISHPKSTAHKQQIQHCTPPRDPQPNQNPPLNIVLLSTRPQSHICPSRRSSPRLQKPSPNDRVPIIRISRYRALRSRIRSRAGDDTATAAVRSLGRRSLHSERNDQKLRRRRPWLGWANGHDSKDSGEVVCFCCL